ncbi:glycosyltransferase family 9 protein [Verticiella sediminum]|uniref:Glycosyltransferase family 9 protein n=1 Tax=Verticiella sediminum TaxID=1247510 RepID=A0A556AF66_9BURK|nr:glycosyltransferase family 9 protein [Verticiella sediminum]TSH91513.1 glycosyltransferase family 9 protein [Verticiella sediminum]
MNDSSWAAARKLLCIRVDNMGDVLMTSPAVRALRAAVPGRRITLLASPSGAAIAGLLPEVDEILAYEAPWVKLERATPVDADLSLIERLRTQGFDAAVIFTTYSQSALPAAMMCRLAGIPRVLAHARENPYQLLTDWACEGGDLDDGRHEVQRQLDLVACVGARIADERMRLSVPPAARAALTLRLARHGVTSGGGWVLVHPGATAPSRRYPAQAFAAAMAGLPDDGTPLFVTGSAGERALADEVCRLAGRGINLAGELPLAEFAALVEAAGVLVSNNSGPVHVAAATGTPVVDLYALTNPQHTPWRVASRVLYHDVPCRFCHRSICPEGHNACLRGVPPAAVLEAAIALLAEPARAGPDAASRAA